MYKLKLFPGNSNLPLAQSIAKHLGIVLLKVNVGAFSDGETRVEIKENIRGMDVFIIQPTCPPVNHNLMELIIMIDAARRASADRITAIIPYYGYARQDQKVAPRTPITAKLAADLLTIAGANRVLAMDLHAGQIQGFFNIPVDNLLGSKVILRYLSDNFQKIVMIAPHAGETERARAYAKRLNGAPFAIIDKRDKRYGGKSSINIIGKVAGREGIIISDMVDTGKTVCEAAEVLAMKKVSRIIACATHPVLSEEAVERIGQSPIEKVIVTDTIPLNQAAVVCGKFEVLPVSKLFADAIERIHRNDSVSMLLH